MEKDWVREKEKCTTPSEIQISFPAIVRGEKSCWENTWEHFSVSRKIRVPILKSDPDNDKLQSPVVSVSFVSVLV